MQCVLYLLLEIVGYGGELLTALAINGILEARMICIQFGAIHKHVLCLIQIGYLARKPNHVAEVWKGK